MLPSSKFMCVFTAVVTGVVVGVDVGKCCGGVSIICESMMLTLLAIFADASTSVRGIVWIEDGGGKFFGACVVCDASATHACV